ncbi:MAG TPA: hypothetical protein VK894_01845, partial [Jiangellales bacterium]|nr:hypothetical protein [Jiangellales bacterium]
MPTLTYPGADRVARTFRRIVSGDPEGQPAWVRAMREGEDEGLFGPGSAPWAVHGHRRAGVRPRPG